LKNDYSPQSRKGQNLFIPIETKVRELDAKLLFALAAAESGWSVVLGAQKNLRRCLHKFSPGVYVDKSVTVNKQKWFQYCRELGHKVVAWDEEGLVFFDAETLSDTRIDRQSFRHLEMFIAWGEHQKEAIQSTFPGTSKTICVAGNPRCDLLRAELRGMYEASSRHLVEAHGHFILVNTSFPFANHFLGDEAMHMMYANYPINKRRPNFYKEWAEVHASALASFQQLIPELSKAFPKYTIIVRPHPSENHENWRQWVKGIPRAEVIATGPVIDWIAAAEFMIHFDCTTGIEAFAMDAFAIAFDEEKVPGYRQPLPRALSYHARSVDEVIALGMNVLNGDLTPCSSDPQRNEIAHKNIASLSGPLAVDRIVEVLNNMSEKNALNDISSGIRKYLIQSNVWYVQVRDAVQKILGKRGTVYAAQKFPDTSVSEIKERAAKISFVLDRFTDITIGELGKNCFEIKMLPGQQ
jgi:surface carbohydrate biosynthesis protein